MSYLFVSICVQSDILLPGQCYVSVIVINGVVQLMGKMTIGDCGYGLSYHVLVLWLMFIHKCIICLVMCLGHVDIALRHLTVEAETLLSATIIHVVSDILVLDQKLMNVVIVYT